MFHPDSFRLSADDQLRQVHRRTGKKRHRCEGAFLQGQSDGNRQANTGRDDRAGGCEDRGDRHGSQYRVRDVIQEGPDEAVVDLLSDGNERKHTDQIRGSGHDRQIGKEGGKRHDVTSFLSSEAVGSSSTG